MEEVDIAAIYKQVEFGPMSKWIEQETTKMVENVRIKGLTKEPFMAGKGFALKIRVAREIGGNPMPTMATNGKEIYVNPEFLKLLTTNEKVFVFLHELLHVILGHTLRRDWRDPEKWNVACDHEVNNLLVDNGYIMPPIGICDRKFQNWHVEKIYAELYGTRAEAEQKKQQQGDEASSGEAQAGDGEPKPDGGDPSEPNGDQLQQGSGSGEETDGKDALAGQVLDGVGDEGDTLSKEEMVEALEELRIENAVSKTTTIIAGTGQTICNSVAVHRVSVKKKDFETLFKKWFNKRGAPGRSTWRKLNRRRLAARQYAPGRKREGAEWIVYACDVSGSMDRQSLVLVNSMMEKCRASHNVKRITVLPFNSKVRVQDIRELSHGQPVPTDMRVGGGTSFAPVFDWVREQGRKPDGIIMFTDMGSNQFGEPVKGVPVLWASSTPLYKYTYGTDKVMTNHPPFGEAVEIQCE